jgi:hypothetical protein
MGVLTLTLALAADVLADFSRREVRELWPAAMSSAVAPEAQRVTPLVPERARDHRFIAVLVESGERWMPSVDGDQTQPVAMPRPPDQGLRASAPVGLDGSV